MLGRDSFFPQVYVARGRETFQTDQYQATSKTITHHRNALKFLGKLFSSSSSLLCTGLILPGFTPSYFFVLVGLFWVFLWAYSTFLIRTTKPFYSTVFLCSTCVPTNMLITHMAHLHSRTQPLLCLANEANYRFLSGVGGQSCTMICLDSCRNCSEKEWIHFISWRHARDFSI